MFIRIRGSLGDNCDECHESDSSKNSNQVLHQGQVLQNRETVVVTSGLQTIQFSEDIERYHLSCAERFCNSRLSIDFVDF